MAPFLALLAFLQTAGLQSERFAVPGPGGVSLDAVLVHASGSGPRGPAIVALHGCGGPFAERDGPWAAALARAGHTVLLPDSFGSRGLGSQCAVKEADRPVGSGSLRRDDAIAAGRFLAARPDTPPGGLALMGWSNGGGTVLAVADAIRAPPPDLFRRYVAFYPGCEGRAKSASWRPAARLMILVGENDDWTPAPPCRVLAARFPDAITLTLYPGAYHDFDAFNRPVRLRDGAATAVGGRAHTGTNEPARADALARVPAWLEMH